MSDIDIRQLLLDAEDNANSGNYIESANLYKKVTIIDDNSSAAWYGLGVIHAKLGNFENSVNSFEQAHRINPDHGPTNANLALILEKSDSERAANFAKMALENIGENKDLLRISKLNIPKEIKLFDSSHSYSEENEEEGIINIPANAINDEESDDKEELDDKEEAVIASEEENFQEVEEIDFVNSRTARTSRASKMSQREDPA